MRPNEISCVRVYHGIRLRAARCGQSLCCALVAGRRACPSSESRSFCRNAVAGVWVRMCTMWVCVLSLRTRAWRICQQFNGHIVVTTVFSVNIRLYILTVCFALSACLYSVYIYDSECVRMRGSLRANGLRTPFADVYVMIDMSNEPTAGVAAAVANKHTDTHTLSSSCVRIYMFVYTFAIWGHRNSLFGCLPRIY